MGVATLSDTVVNTLYGYVDEMERCLLPGDLPRLIQIDLAFHQTIAALGDSETLLEIWSNLNGRIGALIIRSLEANQLHIEDVVSYHTEVIEALATRSPSAARVGNYPALRERAGRGDVADRQHGLSCTVPGRCVGMKNRFCPFELNWRDTPCKKADCA